ncbi:Ig-like domain-containing protein, partial [bacterium]|nr:Ig-like domain-containing protein [bacterium]
TLQVVKNEINYEIGQDTTDIESIIVTLNGQDVTNKVNFTSTNENVATVDENGKITFIAEGETQIIIHLDGANDQIVTVKVTLPELEINKSEITLQVGETEQLTVKLKGEDKTNNGANYQSSNQNIATVDENGKITAIAEGKTEITVKVDGAEQAIISVTVPHQKATLSKDSFNIMLGNSEALPDVTLRGEPAICQFQSSDPNVVTIDENGNIKTVGVGETTITTTCNGDDITIPIKVYDTLTTTATNSTGETININTKVLAGEEANNMKIILRDTGMIDNENAVQNIVQIDKTSDVGDVTIDIDAKNDTQVAVISTNQDGTIDYVSTETVQDGKITINSVSNKNIYQVAEEDENGNIEMVLTTAGFYKDDVLIASWDQCNSWRANWWLEGNGGSSLMNSHPELLEANKWIIPEGITKLITGVSPNHLFLNVSPFLVESGSKLNTVVLPNSLEKLDLGETFHGIGITNLNVRSNNEHYKSIDGVVYSKDLTELLLCPPRKTKLIIPSSVIRLGGCAISFNQATSIGAE